MRAIGNTQCLLTVPVHEVADWCLLAICGSHTGGPAGAEACCTTCRHTARGVISHAPVCHAGLPLAWGLGVNAVATRSLSGGVELLTGDSDLFIKVLYSLLYD